MVKQTKSRLKSSKGTNAGKKRLGYHVILYSDDLYCDLSVL